MRGSGSRKILGISGSLRAGSSNARLLLAAAKLAPAGMRIELHGGMAALPLFSPDLDVAPPPAPVRELRRAVADADGLLISSPEYAHGVPGALKNALDWLVSGTEFPGKPVVAFCGGELAPAQLEETLKAMSARVLRVSGVHGPVLRKAFGADGNLVDEKLAREVQECLALF